MTAIAYSPQGSQTQAKNTTALSQLVSYGMVDVTLFGSAGEELNISSHVFPRNSRYGRKLSFHE